MTDATKQYYATCETTDDKRELLAIIRGVNNTIVAEPSGCGDGYYITFKCTKLEYVEIMLRWIKR